MFHEEGERTPPSPHKNLLIVECFVGLCLGVTIVPEMLAWLPEAVKILTNSGIVAGSVTAIILIIIPSTSKQKKKTNLLFKVKLHN